LGNPQFVGARWMNQQQKQELLVLFDGVKNNGNLDYVTSWYMKAAQYILGTSIECAFVSTNSICQGGQVNILWSYLFDHFNLRINFAHQTFKWSNEARGKAAVHCIIVGFSLFDRNKKRLYVYDTITSDPKEIAAKWING